MHPIEQRLRVGHPILRIVTIEEDGAVQTLIRCARRVLGEATAVREWSADGFVIDDGATSPSAPATIDEVLRQAAGEPGPALFILRDAHRFLDDIVTSRRLRSLVRTLGERPVRVVLVVPPGELPIELQHELPTLSFSVPPVETLVEIVEQELEMLDGLRSMVVAESLSGLSSREARLALRSARASALEGDALLTHLFAAKAERVQASCLIYHAPGSNFDDLGGLAGFKRWLRMRVRRGLDERAPRGILLTGISGCGKSQAIKTLARELLLPLFRLDMARVFANPQPEAMFTSALASVEALAPCVLWLDEIENALALGAQDHPSAARISGSFLTWLQERPPGVFVGATANRVDLLPAELLRRGRFNQVMFVDLPDDEERKSIWAVHLRRAGLDPAGFDLIVLAGATPGWSGAEIEACVESARLAAAADGREPNRDHVLRATSQIVPLSVTMKEQIKKIREWAHQRAILASGKS